jgi:hypothetical protein
MATDTSIVVLEPTVESPANDMLRGTDALADFLGLTPRQTRHLIRKKQLPFGRLGGMIIGSKAKLRQRYDELISGQA